MNVKVEVENKSKLISYGDHQILVAPNRWKKVRQGFKFFADYLSRHSRASITRSQNVGSRYY